MSNTVTWRIASSFPASCATLWQSMVQFAEHVAILTEGRFRIEPTPAGEPYAVTDLLDLVASGEIQGCHAAGSFFMDRDPVLALTTFIPFGLNARRHAAWLDGPGAAFADTAWAQQGVVALPCGNTGSQTGGWFRASVTNVSCFQNLRIRTAGLPALVYERLGAKPVSLPADAILPALQTGTLDAADWIGPADDLAMGFHTAAPFYHMPGVLEPSAQLSLAFNRDAWSDLPDGWRRAIGCAAAAAERSIFVSYDTVNPIALNSLMKAGVSIVRFPPDVLDAMRAATTAILNDVRGQNQEFAAALASYREFENLGRPWAIMGESETANAILSQNSAHSHEDNRHG